MFPNFPESPRPHGIAKVLFEMLVKDESVDWSGGTGGFPPNLPRSSFVRI